MGKKDKKVDDATAAANPPPAKESKKSNLDGSVLFDSSEATLDKTAKATNLGFVTKPWTRDAYERARPWLLEQRQKLESQGWSPVDGARTELFVLKRNAPAGSFTEDGSVYIRVPKKFIDFTRSGKGGADDAAAAADEEGDGKKKKATRLSKKKENAPSYELNDPWVWKLKIENAESEDAARVPSVILDVHEAMENIMYLIMCLQPGMIQLQASRKNVVQPGTKQSATRDDAGTPTVRHTALVASSEHYTRFLPPAFWFKRNAESLQKVLCTTGTQEYDDLLAAAENVQRSVTRDIKDVEERTWEEKIGGHAANKDAAAAADAAAAPAPAEKGKKGKSAAKKAAKEAEAEAVAA